MAIASLGWLTLGLSLVVIVTYGGQTRIASLFLPPADVARLLRLGLEEIGRPEQSDT